MRGATIRRLHRGHIRVKVEKKKEDYVSKRLACKSTLLATVGGLALALPIISYAQDAGVSPAANTSEAAAAVTEGDAVVVTGTRASLRSARNLKRNANQIVDSIQATDIGKLPDVNTVESLQRITGVQIQRRYGEGGTDYDHRTEPAITIRGMTQVRNLIDGRDFFTANGGRAPDLEGLPSELMAGVDVYKNAASNLIEGGVGGVVDIRTRLPFDSKLPINSITLKANYYDRIEKSSPSVSALFSRQFDTGAGRMGFLVNASMGKTYYRQDAVLQQQQHVITATSNPTAFASFPNKGSLSTLYVPTSFEIYQDSGERERKGLALAYQWQINEDMLFTAQNIHSEYQFIRRGEYLYGDDKNTDPRAAAGSTFTWDSDGTATSGVLSPQIFSTSRFDQDVRNHTNLSTLNFKWQITDKLRSKTDFAYEYATYDADRNGDSVKLYDNESRSVANIPQLNMAFDVRGKYPTFSIVDPANPTNPYAYFGNPNNWYYEWLANAVDRHRLKMAAFVQDFDYDTGGDFFTKLHAGVRVSDTKVLLRGNWDNTGVCNDTGTNPSWSACPLIPVSEHPNLAWVGPADNFMKPGVGFAVAIFPEYADPNSSVFDRTVKTYAQLFAGKPNTYTFRTTFNPSEINEQHETTQAAYVSGDFDTTLMGYGLDGTVGVRAVKTKLESIGYIQDSTGSHEAVIENEYTNILPSFNARLHVSNELQFRAAFGQTITRPNFTDMATHVQLNPNIPSQYDAFGRPTGSSGNPYLKPMKATSYDLTAEYYWGSSNLAFFGVFKKDVEGYQASGIEVMNFGGVDYSISTSINLGKGTIKGFEIGYTQFFDFLPGLWSGLGVQANYTRVDSKVERSAGVFIPLPKLSKDSYNFIALYEKGPVQARIAYNWRSSYLDQLNGSGVFGANQYAAPYSSLDASASYQINDVFSVSVDAVNLGNSMYHTYVERESGGLLWQLNDRRYSLTLKANF
jgi:iron complex outermembrane recepter protein